MGRRRRFKWRLARLSRRIKRWGQQTQHFLVDVVYSRKKGLGVLPIAALLAALSFVFEGIVRLRGFLYSKRVLRNQPLGCLVITVGNLTVGGTGKTPIVELLAHNLMARGRTVAILSRGYKSKPERMHGRALRWLLHKPLPPPRIVSDGKKVLLGSDVAGDEPYMLARNLPGTIVLTAKNRVAAGQYAIKHFGADTLLLDDGFQYLPLKGRMNVLLIDKTNPFGNGRLLPRGILREPISRLKRADTIFITKSNAENDDAYNAIKETVARHKPGTTLIQCMHRMRYLAPVNKATASPMHPTTQTKQTEQAEHKNKTEYTEHEHNKNKHGFLNETSSTHQLPIHTLKGKKVAALSGIAMPEGFEKQLELLGAELVYSSRYLDHHRYKTYELDRFFRLANIHGAQWAITTEKDAVRISSAYSAALPFYYLRMEIDVLQNAQQLDMDLDKACLQRQTSPPFSFKKP